MPYLVTVETISHVDIRCILGIAEDSIEVHSLLFNFYKSCQNKFEANIIHFKITVLEVLHDNTAYIKLLYDKYEEEIEELKTQYDIWKVEDMYGNYVNIPYINSEDTVIFDDEEVKCIENLINNAIKIL